MLKFGQLVCAGFVLAHLTILTAIDGRTAEPETPPLPWTQEKVKPPEIEDKDKKGDVPVAACEKKDKEGDKYHELIYSDGTKVRYWTDQRYWVIEIPGPNGPTKITYDAAKKSKTVKEPGKPAVKLDPAKDPGAKKWKDALDQAEQDAKKKSDLTPRLASPVRQASLRTPWSDNWITKIGYTAFVRSPVSRSAAAARAPAPLQLAALAEKNVPQEKPAATQAHVVINLKVVTYGGPPTGVTIHFDPEDPKRPTPDEFVKKEDPQNTWKPDDVPGPGTTPGPKPGGFIPVDPKDTGGGGWVNIGGGWAYTRIPVSFFESCASDVDDSDDGPGGGPTKASDKPKQQSSAPSEPQEPRREAIEQRQAREWDEGPQQTAQRPTSMPMPRTQSRASQRGKYDLAI